MNKILSALVLVCISASCLWADVEINEANFPDDNFRTYVSNNFDTNKDGILSSSETEYASTIDVSSSDISSLKGIEHFLSLNALNCSNNNLSELNLSENIFLMGLFCGNNKIASLDLGDQVLLLAVQCPNNEMNYINLEGCGELVSLDCTNNNLTQLNVKDCKDLSLLQCGRNNLKTLDVSGLKSLKILDCSSNGMEVVNNSTITVNGITSLNVSGCTSLTELKCADNSMTVLDVSGCSSLVDLDCNWNQLETLKAYNCTSLKNINCRRNKLTQIDLRGCSALRDIDCYQNKLTSLDVSTFKNLQQLMCSENLLASLKINPELVYLQCSGNNLSELDVSRSQALVVLQCGFNKLTKLNTRNNTKLLTLTFEGNQIESIDVYGNTEIEILDCRYNHLTELDLSNNKWLGYSDNAYVRIGSQFVNELNISANDDADSLYEYVLDLSSYVSSGKIGSIISSSIRAFDENDTEIESVYSGGKVFSSLNPSRIEYTINTGFQSLSMDVSIGTVYYSSIGLNNHVYRAFSLNEARTWTEAKTYCESLGGHLATITTEEENKILAELIDKAWLQGEPQSVYWLGGEYKNGKWNWVTSEDFNYIPDDSSLTSIFSDTSIFRFSDTFNYLRTSNTYELWIGDEENQKFGFICEWEPVSTDFAD